MNSSNRPNRIEYVSWPQIAFFLLVPICAPVLGILNRKLSFGEMLCFAIPVIVFNGLGIHFVWRDHGWQKMWVPLITLGLQIVAWIWYVATYI